MNQQEMLDALRNHISSEAAFKGHSYYCRAVCGPAGEAWIENQKCDCGLREILALIEKNDTD